MGQEQDPSPEEILLRLIKEGKSSAKAPKESQPKTPSPGSGQVPEPEMTIPALESASALASPPPHSPLPLGEGRVRVPWGASIHGLASDLHVVPRVLLLLSVALAGLILIQIVRDALASRRNLDRLWKTATSVQTVGPKATDKTAAPALAGGLPDKDLFKFVQPAAPVLDRGPGPSRVTGLDQILSNYVLSGIIGGDTPQAVIEDKRQGKTFFVNVGDMIGEMRILKIEEGRVTVAVGDQQAQLEL